ncbi:MAG: PASTA domain-containing protein [Clostridiales bacterium]|nr:PASTA domain-containing protein [Clostridiales bacterium]
MDTNNTFLESYKKKTEEQSKQEIDKQVPDTKGPADSAFRKGGFVKPPTKEPTSSVKKPAQSKRVAAIVVSVVVVALLIFAIYMLLNRGIEMVGLVGWTENDAQLWARNNGILLQIEQEYNDDMEAGKVLSQNVAEGTQVKKGEFVKLTVSLGHDLSVTFPIPDIMSMTKNEIDTWAAENFMTKVRVTTEFSDLVESGKVIRFEINDNTVVNEVRRDSPVYVIISKGPEDVTAANIEVPNFKIMSIAEAYAFAEENGLILAVEEEYDDFAPLGAIISQSIKAEEKVPEETEIKLLVSRGKMILVPNFSKYPKELAPSVAGELGISINITEKYSGRSAGKFISQSIKADTVYESGQIVELNYSIDNKITLPSFIGQTRDVIETWAKELNSNGASIGIKVTNTKSNSPPGTILTQSKANTLVDINTSISITVSSGKVVFAPDFLSPAGSGYDAIITREKAIAICEELNIIPVFVEENKSGKLPGEIWYQSVGAGMEIKEGSTITLKYVPANVQLVVPDFTNLTKNDIITKNLHKSFNITYVEGYKEGFEDKVYEQSLKAGTRMATGSEITLTIGIKEEPIIPDPDPTEEPEPES